MSSTRRQTVVIGQDANVAKTFKAFINIDFIPDEMIVREVSYINNRTELLPVMLFSSLVNLNICSFIDGTSTSPNTTFTIKKPVNNNYDFQFRAFNDLPAILPTGVMILHLEFVQWGTNGKLT